MEGHEGERAGRADESISGSLDQTTDKHKAIWLCELKIVQDVLESAGAQGSGAFGQNVGKKHGGKGGETRRGQKRSGPWTYNHQNYQDIRETQAADLAQPYHEARETEAAGRKAFPRRALCLLGELLSYRLPSGVLRARTRGCPGRPSSTTR